MCSSCLVKNFMLKKPNGTKITHKGKIVQHTNFINMLPELYTIILLLRILRKSFSKIWVSLSYIHINFGEIYLIFLNLRSILPITKLLVYLNNPQDVNIERYKYHISIFLIYDLTLVINLRSLLYWLGIITTFNRIWDLYSISGSNKQFLIGIFKT